MEQLVTEACGSVSSIAGYIGAVCVALTHLRATCIKINEEAGPLLRAIRIGIDLVSGNYGHAKNR